MPKTHEEIDSKWLDWLYEAEQAKCRHDYKHAHADMTGHAGPESGYDEFYCPVCKFEAEVIYY